MTKTRYRHTPSEAWHKFREQHSKGRKRETPIKYGRIALKLFDIRCYDLTEEALT